MPAAKAFAHQMAGLYREAYGMYVGVGGPSSTTSPPDAVPTFVTRKVTQTRCPTGGRARRTGCTWGLPRSPKPGLGVTRPKGRGGHVGGCSKTGRAQSTIVLGDWRILTRSKSWCEACVRTRGLWGLREEPPVEVGCPVHASEGTFAPGLLTRLTRISGPGTIRPG